MKMIVLTAILPVIFFCSCSSNHQTKPVMPAGEYLFSCATGLISSDTALRGWNPINQFKSSSLVYRVKNDSAIEVGHHNSTTSKKNLLRVTQFPDAAEYRKLPQRHLDFELQGVYHEQGHPAEVYSILYYSRQRHALMRQYHSGLNNIDVVALFFPNGKDTINPFKNHSRFFKLGHLDFHEKATLKAGG